ncbi:MAG: ABC transporter ATP-binding protein [Actinomycetales bacterium]|nr:ABC transporter ATP-binding protein [Actinomycetales bacterium]
MVNPVKAQVDVEQLTVSFGAKRAVAEVNVSVAPGEVTAILGPSGCGKSTLLRAIAGLTEPSSGAVFIDGADQRPIPAHRRGCVLLFQDGQLFDHRSVAENVGYALKLRRAPREQVRVRVAELLELVGLGDMADRAPATLSGGERQRVALARALAAEPRVLLLDEPLSALDRELRTRLADDLARIVRDAGITTIVVTHDHDEAFVLADNVMLMREGKIVQSGPLAEVWGGPKDEWVAGFLGYDQVLDGGAAAAVARAARLVLEPGGQLAARASAFVTDASGELAARMNRVRRVSATHVALDLELDDPIGAVAAVVGRGEAVPRAGDDVQVAIDAAQLAPIG